MYIDKLTLTNVRTFVKNELRLLHPDSIFRSPKAEPDGNEHLLPRPKLPNVNLLLGDNGSGKTTVLQAIALASLGPAAERSQLPLRKFVRISTNRVKAPRGLPEAAIRASLILHSQDNAIQRRGESLIQFRRLNKELESLHFGLPYDLSFDGHYGAEDLIWDPVFESKNEAFFCAAYGATRRMDAGESRERGATPKTPFLRGQRLQSIFQDSYALVSLEYWLPRLKVENKGRYVQAVSLLNHFLKPGSYRFTGQMAGEEYLFERGGMRVPFRSLSDGYRAFISWVTDLLYHICYGCPSGKKLVESAGVVLVDEIDLHLHPKWQMKVVGSIAKALPRVQFVFTSHSPLIASSLEWMNIITFKVHTQSNRTKTGRLNQSIHGLDADQVLLSDFFGLKSTRAASKREELTDLRQQATAGGDEEKLAYIRALSSGLEPIAQMSPNALASQSERKVK